MRETALTGKNWGGVQWSISFLVLTLAGFSLVGILEGRSLPYWLREIRGEACYTNIEF